MKFKYGKLLALLGAISALSSCAYFSEEHLEHLSPQQKVCSELHNELIYNAPAGSGPNTYTPNPNMTKTNPLQQARVMKQYERYNCEAIE